jgi:hypothetical protein
VVHYRWHPLYGMKARRIQGERRASGEFVHVELTPGAVTILPVWKLDAIYCASLKVGAPQVSLAALCTLHELLVVCESRLISADDNTITQEIHDEIAGSARTKDEACSKTEAEAAESTTPARLRSRRRAPPGNNSKRAPSSAQIAGTSPAGGKRRRNAGGER